MQSLEKQGLVRRTGEPANVRDFVKWKSFGKAIMMTGMRDFKSPPLPPPHTRKAHCAPVLHPGRGVDRNHTSCKLLLVYPPAGRTCGGGPGSILAVLRGWCIYYEWPF